MATSANFSSVTATLSIAIDGAGTYTINNPELAFRIAKIDVYNGAGTPTIQVTDGTNDIAASQNTVTGGWLSLVLNQSYCNINTGESIQVIVANASTTRVLITCVDYNGGYPWAVT